jgi:hypothetical protein
MKFEIVKLANLSGRKTTIYSAILGDYNQTLFKHFLTNNKSNQHEKNGSNLRKCFIERICGT